ncbi:MAG: DUF357 domain-containing protein [Candidatus Aenigmarchaeota archaeon]|nr:DUF357 domain-containing protein [Candidatus Aenigmarchaeota archaeon]
MDTEMELKKETQKWLERIEKELGKGTLKDGTKEDILRNARNYVKDCRYFIDKKDWVRAFEAVVYAWGIIDTLKRIGIVEAEE